MVAPPEVLEAAANWQSLTRWERAELGRRLRRMGWTYAEIMGVLPVVKGTLAGWCREIRLSDSQIAEIKARVPTQKGIPKDTNRKRRVEIEAIREQASLEVRFLKEDPLWIAGNMLYWAEGDKSSRRLSMVNTDARALTLFIDWTRKHHDLSAEFVLALHLHHGNDEEAARQWWCSELGLAGAEFHKTFIKPPGTGHRKNRLAYGVCRVMMRRSGDAWQRTMAWIDELVRELREPHQLN
ncbi:MAG TPA: hypothetical protein VGK83_07800 [Acidimicrobiia bacterium]